jgi:hypothetical protein
MMSKREAAERGLLAARGMVLGLLMGAVFWIVLGLAVWFTR